MQTALSTVQARDTVTISSKRRAWAGACRCPLGRLSLQLPQEGLGEAAVWVGEATSLDRPGWLQTSLPALCALPRAVLRPIFSIYVLTAALRIHMVVGPLATGTESVGTRLVEAGAVEKCDDKSKSDKSLIDL